MDGIKYRIRIVNHPRTPTEARRARYRAAQREMALKLFDVLWKQPLPAVVDIEEFESFDPPEFPQELAEQSLTIEATIAPVQHMNVTVARYDGYAPRRKPASHLKRWLTRLADRLP